METMRVYEFARICGVPAKDLIVVLAQAGFDIKSHMSVLSSRELEFLNKKYLNVRQVAVPTVETEKKNLPTKEQVSEPDLVTPRPTVQKVEKKLEADVEKKPIVSEGIIVESMTVSEFAAKTHKLSSEIILVLLRMGIVATKNQMINQETVARLVEHYQLKVSTRSEMPRASQEIFSGQTAIHERPPVVVVVGHVDHGKTTLLDFIRKTKVAAKEKGGITQHLGAYEVKTIHGNVIFLDTPGHEAFSKMRGRGIGVADIAVLIVAADDGIMPQTVEAIKFAQAAKLPIIVAINKVDKVDASRIDSVRRGLAQYGILPEEWGGDVVCLPISAKTGMGVDQLIEMIILQAQLMELKADASRQGIGYVLESKPEKGRGPIATVLCKHGITKIGDYFVCGNTTGKVSSLTNSYGTRLSEVGPAVPVQIAGFAALPEVGSLFKVVGYDEYRVARELADTRHNGRQNLVAEGALNLIVKIDSISTKEALLGAIEKLSKGLGKEFNIVHAGVGGVSESDVTLAVSTGSAIITLHVKPEVNAALLARNYGVSITTFDIIYKFLEYLEERVQSEKEVVMVKTKIGEAVVRQVFEIKNVGVVAGCYVKEGRFTRDGLVSIVRRGKEIGSGAIKSLQRERKSVKEVHAGFECGFVVDGFVDFAVDDQIFCYLLMPEK
jgi:translation initiation factor IF-2